MRFYCVQLAVSVNASLLYVAGSECDNVFTLWGDGGAGHWLVRMEWRPAGWSVCLPLLIFPCTMKSRSSLLAPADPSGPGKRAIKRLCVCAVIVSFPQFILGSCKSHHCRVFILRSF